VFAKDTAGAIFHTYSTYGRGEAGRPPQYRVRRDDEYDNAS
jgi:hypothetical protein